jgi:RimJ/RimL family protein N-acetyltransferase
MRSELVHGDWRIDQWVAQKLGLRQWPMSYSIANVRAEDSFILGATVFHDYYPENGVVELTSYSEHPAWMSRKMINAVFTHAFEGLKCQLVVLRVSETNIHMRDIAERLLFNSYTIPRLRGRNEADVIYTLSDDDWAKSRYRSH